MSDSPLAPRLLKGAIVSLNLPDPVPGVIAFQYNPETLTRTLEAQTGGSENADRAEALRLRGAPVETIKLDIELDAADQLGKGEPIAQSSGIYPRLAALEMLVYPRSALVVANNLLLSVGTVEVIPAGAPFTLFIWGPKRILPVRLTEFTITEEAYDPLLNPIRAKVSLGLRVLSYNDLPISHPGFHLFMAHQVVKEAMAALALGNSLSDILGGPIRLL